MSLLQEISSTLETAGIRHALIGALALSAHGVNRATLDLDLLVADTDSLRPELWADLRGRGISFARLSRLSELPARSRPSNG